MIPIIFFFYPVLSSRSVCIFDDHNSKMCIYCQLVWYISYILSSRSLCIYLMTMTARCVYIFKMCIYCHPSQCVYLMTMIARCRILQQLPSFLLLLAVAFTMQRKLRHKATSLWTTDNIELLCFFSSLVIIHWVLFERRKKTTSVLINGNNLQF